MLLIYLRYEKFFIRNKCTINFTESVKALSINSLNGVKSYIYIPPRIIKINSIPGMVILNIFSFITVNYIAGDILTTTKRGKQMGKVITDSFSGFDCFMYIKIHLLLALILFVPLFVLITTRALSSILQIQRAIHQKRKTL